LIKTRGPQCKFLEIYQKMKYFSIENSVDRVHGSVDRAAPWSTVDRRHRAQPELARELAERCHAAPKLTAAARGGRGRRRGAHRGQNLVREPLSHFIYWNLNLVHGSLSIILRNVKYKWRNGKEHHPFMFLSIGPSNRLKD
jgi:hypothetical protein